MSDAIPVIAIDGPVGSGKGTISQLLAAKLGWHYLESGALYRILAYSADQRGISLDNESKIAELAGTLKIEFVAQTAEAPMRILCDGEDVSTAIRHETVGTMASKISAFPAVREALLTCQRQFLKQPGLVADGRDMGTVIFPEAPLKIFLEASALERAKRRQLQLLEMGIDVKLADLESEITERDQRDRNRAISPLKPAADATIVDTTPLTIDGVFEAVWQCVKQKGLS